MPAEKTVYIAHFYPPEDASQFFRKGSHLLVAGQVFDTYAEAANQLAQELGDIVEDELPVCGYVIEAEEHPSGLGYRVLDCFESSHRAANSGRRTSRSGRGGLRTRNASKPRAEQQIRADLLAERSMPSIADLAAGLLDEIEEEIKPARASRKPKQEPAFVETERFEEEPAQDAAPFDLTDLPDVSDLVPATVARSGKRGAISASRPRAAGKAAKAAAAKAAKAATGGAAKKTRAEKAADKAAAAAAQPKKPRGRPKKTYTYDTRPAVPVSQRKRVGEMDGLKDTWLADLKGIERGKTETRMPKREAADKYSDFMAEYAPWDVPARNLSGALMRKLRGPVAQAQLDVQADAREEGSFQAGQQIVDELKAGADSVQTAEEAAEKVGELRAIVSEAKQEHNIPVLEQAQLQLSLYEAKANTLEILEAFCPYYCSTAKGKKGIKAAKAGGYALPEDLRRYKEFDDLEALLNDSPVRASTRKSNTGGYYGRR